MLNTFAFIAACEKPELKDGNLTDPELNKIGKLKAGTIVMSNCNYGFETSSDHERQNLTCDETDSQWKPNVTCLRKRLWFIQLFLCDR